MVVQCQNSINEYTVIFTLFLSIKKFSAESRPAMIMHQRMKEIRERSNIIYDQGRWQKNFQGGGVGTTDKRTKNGKKYRKITLLSLVQGEGVTEKKTEK